VVGANDELFNAGQFAPLMRAINPSIGVTVVPNEGHLAMIADPEAIATIVTVWRRLHGG
jgi:pimeloyl-ACP methyl ester carboxylesterase